MLEDNLGFHNSFHNKGFFEDFYEILWVSIIAQVKNLRGIPYTCRNLFVFNCRKLWSEVNLFGLVSLRNSKWWIKTCLLNVKPIQLSKNTKRNNGDHWNYTSTSYLIHATMIENSLLENIVYHFWRQLWLVLGRKFMEIYSNLFCRLNASQKILNWLALNHLQGIIRITGRPYTAPHSWYKLYLGICALEKHVFSIPKQQSPCSPAKFTIQRPASASHNDTITIKKNYIKKGGYTLETWQKNTKNDVL